VKGEGEGEEGEGGSGEGRWGGLRGAWLILGGPRIGVCRLVEMERFVGLLNLVLKSSRTKKPVGK